MTDNRAWQPLVSIVTPSFNQSEFLEETIRSVLAQDYPRIEYLVMDGGSSDGSVEIIRRHESGITKWVSEPDAGQADAINKGFRMARGDIVAWLNSDDVYLPKAVSTAVRRFREQPDLALFYGDAVFISRDGDFIRYFTEVEPYDGFRLLNCSDFIMQPTTFFRRDRLLEAGLLDPSLHWTMDYDLWCRFAAREFRFHYEPEPIAANREYEGTKTVDGSGARLEEIARVCRRHRTSWWPHASFSYRRHELELGLRARSPAVRRLARATFGNLLKVLAYRNSIHALFHTRAIGGVAPHSTVCGRRARLCLPVWRPAAGIRLVLQCDLPENEARDQRVEISVNGEHEATFAFVGNRSPRELILECGERITRDRVADVRLEFSRTLPGHGARFVHAARVLRFGLIR